MGVCPLLYMLIERLQHLPVIPWVLALVIVAREHLGIQMGLDWVRL